MRKFFGVLGFLTFALLAGLCVAGVNDDDDEESWVPTVESSERPGGRDGPGREGEDDCDGSCGNQHRDCENNSGECSDDDQVQVGPFCLQPESCRFG